LAGLVRGRRHDEVPLQDVLCLHCLPCLIAAKKCKEIAGWPTQSVVWEEAETVCTKKKALMEFHCCRELIGAPPNAGLVRFHAAHEVLNPRVQGSALQRANAEVCPRP
jgi:hypothetical protein